MQTKRRRESSPPLDDDLHNEASKRRRTSRSPDILSTLSDELLIRALSFLDESALLDVSQVSHRFLHLASDSQLWRPHYYRRFILPRAHRIPGFATRSSKQYYSTQRTLWSGTAAAAAAGARISSSASFSSAPDKAFDSVNWKKQYKLRHNWARGRCAVKEVPVQEAPSTPSQWQTLVRVVEGLAVTADSASGLRAWDLRTKQTIAQVDLLDDEVPTCIAVEDGPGDVDIAVGFLDGTFAIWKLIRLERTLVLRYKQPKSFIENLVSIAYRYPYVLTAKHSGFISVYTFECPGADHSTTRDDDALPAPYLLTSLKSHTAPSPLALSLRKVSSSVVASIAYTFDTPRGWSIGVQDLEISPAGIVVSRLASTLPTETRNSATSTPTSSPLRPRSPIPSTTPASVDFEDGPTRLSYSHPYLLATLPDNTLALHLCTSTDKSLSISKGMRLWGHTSGISDADITPRGKAVSVSTRGNEIRLWELEGKIGGSSVTVRPRQSDSEDVLSCSDGEDGEERKNWVGFDDEMVIVLKETKGRDSLLLYDFT